MSTTILHQIKEEAEESDEDVGNGRYPLLLDQMNLDGCYTADMYFWRAHTEQERVAMAANEKELFPDRVPVVIESCNKETKY